MRRIAPAVAALALASAVATAAPAATRFVPTDPLVPRQYYLAQDRAFDAWPDALPALPPVKVAIVDSGIDAGHPEFVGKIAATRSFVGGSVADTAGHGTFVAGLIAAAIDGQGIAGIAFPAQLVVAKIVRSDGSIPLDAEAAAIRWAADEGARVINLSLGGVRDPRDRHNDTFSQDEADAVQYAAAKGAVVVAAVGNSDEAPTSPWPFASWPAALPHVIGVAALGPTGAVAPFSDRDPVFDDLAAPGQEMFSTLPRALTAVRPTCALQGYSDCGPPGYRNAAGTSFAAPQVTAAAALLLAARPTLTPDQVSYLLERSATDMTPATGCQVCPAGRDLYTGWGHLDIAQAIAAAQGTLPPADVLEPNDDAGTHARTLTGGAPRARATLDFWDDPIDVYRIRAARGQRLHMTLAGPTGTTATLALWRPGTLHVEGGRNLKQRVTQATGPGSSKRLDHRITATGSYYVEVKLTTRGFGPYTLTVTRSK